MRNFLLILFFYPLFLTMTLSCQSPVKEISPEPATTLPPGWVSVFQTYTSDQETTINILRPRYMRADYYVEVNQGPLTWQEKNQQKVIKTTSGPHIHWKVDRIHAKGLDPKKSYRLVIVNRRNKQVLDWRVFKTLDLSKKKVRFLVGSCMSDSHGFKPIRDKIWDQMLEHKADFLILLGDQVYVDDFDFVRRKKAGEFDLWTRYIDSFRKIPLFQHRNLIPLLAVWDDHDYGSNNADRNFPNKRASKKVFLAFFGGESIKNIYDFPKKGLSFSFNGFSQKFILMDNRYFRESNKNKKYGQWGKVQHKWFQQQLKDSKTPIWLGNGGQFFTKAQFTTLKNGFKKQINESFPDDHPIHFNMLVEDIRKTQQPVVFLSGDRHASEINHIEKSVLGYKSYEITSSPLHSFIYPTTKNSSKKKAPWRNPKSLVHVREHNYVLIDSQSSKKNLKFQALSMGVIQKEPFFKKNLEVKKF